MLSQLLKLPLLIGTALILSACSIGFFASEEVEKKTVLTADSEISVVWSVDLDQRRPASAPGMSNPAVVQGEQGEAIVAGAQDRRVRVFDANGSEIHRMAMSAAGESGGLQLANGLVVVGDVDGKLFGLDINTGSVAWSVELASALMSRPVPVGDDFIVQTENNQVFRFTPNGAKVWSFSGPPGGLGIQLQPSPVVHRDHIYVAMKNGDVVALKADNGSFLWQRQLLLNNNAAVLSELKVPAATPVLILAELSGRHEDMLAVPIFQSDIFFLSLRDGSTLMNRVISSKSSPLQVGKQIYVADTKGALSMLDAAGGETLWKQELSNGELAGPVLWQENLWVADEFGKVFRLSLDGKLLATVELAGRIDLAPVVSSDGVLVRNNHGTLFKLR